MEKIKNFKVKEFLKQDVELVEQYTQLLRLLEPIPTANKIQDLTLREVEFIKMGVKDEESLAEVFEYMEGVDNNGFMNLNITTFYGLYNDIINQLENLLGMEKQELISEHSDFKWEAVDGSKRLSVMGVLPMIDNLAGGDVLKYEQILDMPYMTIFNKLRLERIQRDIERDMSKVKTHKEN